MGFRRGEAGKGHQSSGNKMGFKLSFNALIHLSSVRSNATEKEKTTVKMAIPPVETMHANPTDDQEIQTTLALIECVTILSV
jgi:hypothetical protein